MIGPPTGIRPIRASSFKQIRASRPRRQIVPAARPRWLRRVAVRALVWNRAVSAFFTWRPTKLPVGRALTTTPRQLATSNVRSRTQSLVLIRPTGWTAARLPMSRQLWRALEELQRLQRCLDRRIRRDQGRGEASS
jgi:hypothetical protein